MLVQLKRRPLGAKNISGFTLMEILITLAMLTVLVSLATPSYRRFLVNQQLSSASSNFLGALLQARTEAIKQGKLVSVLPTNGTDWTTGWYLNVVNTDCAETGVPFAVTEAPGGYVSVKAIASSNSFAASKPSFTYNPVGFPYISCASPFYNGSMNGTLTFEATETAREKRIIVSNSGRARLCDPKTDTATPACSGS